MSRLHDDAEMQIFIWDIVLQEVTPPSKTQSDFKATTVYEQMEIDENAFSEDCR